MNEFLNKALAYIKSFVENIHPDALDYTCLAIVVLFGIFVLMVAFVTFVTALTAHTVVTVIVTAVVLFASWRSYTYLVAHGHITPPM